MRNPKGVGSTHQNVVLLVGGRSKRASHRGGLHSSTGNSVHGLLSVFLLTQLCAVNRARTAVLAFHLVTYSIASNMQMALNDMAVVPAKPAGFWANLRATCTKYGKVRDGTRRLWV